MNAILFFLSVILHFALTCIGLIYGLFAKKSDRVKRKYAKMAVIIDILGNVSCAEWFNRWLIKPQGYRFGHNKEWISSVLGKNLKRGTLTRLGKLIVWILSERHCIDAIQWDLK